MENIENSEIWQNVKLATERAWSANFYAKDGSTWIGFYITGIDEENYAVLVEKVGERHLDPTLIYAKDLQKVEVNW